MRLNKNTAQYSEWKPPLHAYNILNCQDPQRNNNCLHDEQTCDRADSHSAHTEAESREREKKKSMALDYGNFRKISRISTLEMMTAKCKHFVENHTPLHVQRHFQRAFWADIRHFSKFCLICEVLLAAAAAASYGFPNPTSRAKERIHSLSQ